MKKNNLSKLFKIGMLSTISILSISNILNATNIKLIQDMTKYPLSIDKISKSTTPILIKN